MDTRAVVLRTLRLCVGLLVLCCPFTVWAGLAPVFKEPFDRGRLPKGVMLGDAKEGVRGTYGRFEDVVSMPRVALPEPIAGNYTLAAWLRTSEWRVESPSGFGERTPPTILVLYDEPSNAPIVFRVHLSSLQLAVNHDGRWDSASSWHLLPVGQWVHVAAVRRGPNVSFYLNGVLDLTTRLHRRDKPLRFVRAASSAKRTFDGDLDEVALWSVALTGAQIAEMVPDEFQRRVADFPVHIPEPKRPAYPGRELRVAAGEASPLIGGLSAHCLPVPWFGPDRCDLLCHGVAFNAHPTINRQLPSGDYAPGVPLVELLPESGLPSPPFYRVDRADGLFDLLSTGKDTPLRDHLLLHRNTGRPGAPAFAPPVSVRCNGLVFRHSYYAAIANVQDIDGDRVPDLLLVRGHMGAPYGPDAPNSFWTGKALPNSGKGRGYSINGRWLGHEGRTMFFWARGRHDREGRIEFGPRLPIHVGRTDFPLQWKGLGRPKATWLRLEGRTWLVLCASIDRILAVPAQIDGDVIRCGEPRNFLADSERLRLLYYPHAMHVADVDRDGAPELVVCGNPGVVVILKGDRIGRFREAAVKQIGGALAQETLIVPCRVDWDGDGRPDIIAGDSSGLLKLWPGTADPMAYRSPLTMRTPSGPVHAQAGYRGSIQGPGEARWGYLNPTVGDWDMDGKLDLITCDICADMLWYRPGKRPQDLAAPVRFTHGGRKLPVAWRQRSAILSPTYGIAGDKPVLLHMNWDGVLCLGIPAEIGSAEITEQRPLAYADGAAVKLDGPCGLWGRAKFAVADWDGDGTWDVIFGTNRSDQKFFCDEFARKEASPFFLRNGGTAAAPVFERPVPIKLGDDCLAFGTHVAAVYPTDMDGDGRDDLIIGAEDGRIYRFLRGELTP